jgi:hypothetical protein
MRVVPLLLIVITHAGIAGAQTADPYKTGVKLEHAGSIVDALAAFESIPPEKRDYNTRLHIASCKKKLGRLLEAERDYEAIRTDPNADQATTETAASDLEDLRSRIPKLRVALSPSTTNVKVTIDGTEFAAPGSVPVNPGAHSVIATRAAKEVYRRELNIAEGTTLDVEIDAPTAAAPSTPQPTIGKKPGPPVAPRSDVDGTEAPFTRTLGLVIGSVGVAAIGGGVFLAVRAANFESDARSAAARGDTSAHDLVDDARSAQLFARIALGVGTVAVIGGGVLVISSLRTSPAKSTAATLKVAPTIGGAWGLSLQGDF